ncbi:MAG: hypothetical protein LBL13_05110 [Bacteroidales bacterium]|jgi:hypothetical protein|nr:hypothetical protein [Bacteroidales bacterium]
MEDEKIKNRIETMLPMPDERQTRIYLASEAQSIGWGGQTKIASLSGKSRFLIARGEKELQNPAIRAVSGNIRRKGGGRRKETDRQAGLVAKIKQIIDFHTVGNHTPRPCQFELFYYQDVMFIDSNSFLEWM